MSQRIVITGGAGFVGSQLARHLVGLGHEVALVDDMSFGQLDNLIGPDGKSVAPIHFADITRADGAAHVAGADVVFHFAGIAALPVCQADPVRAFAINTGGVGQVLEACRHAEVRRVVFSSTSAVYENNVAPHAVTDVVSPDLVYAQTKLAAEQLCRSFSSNYGLDTIICRFFNVYGPHQDIHRTSPPFTSYVAKELVNGRSPVLYNQSDARRDYVHVDDVVDVLTAMCHAPERFAGEVFNIGSGTAYSVPELYTIFARLAGTDLEPEYRDPSRFWDAYPQLFDGFGLDRHRIEKEVYKDSLADIASTQQAFGWSPKVDIDAGLDSVLSFARQFAQA